MTDAAITTAGPTPAAGKVVKKRAAGKPKKAAADHPKYSQMIKEALTARKERGGSSRLALLKYLVKHYRLGHDEKVVNTHLKLALKSGVKNHTLKQSKGSGAAGSFRIGEKKTTEKKPKAKKPKKASAKPKKTKKPKAAGAAKAKKPKSPKKAGAAKPKKAAAAKPKVAKPKVKKPKAAAKPKKPKSPKVKKPKAAARPKKAAAKK